MEVIKVHLMKNSVMRIVQQTQERKRRPKKKDLPASMLTTKEFMALPEMCPIGIKVDRTTIISIFKGSQMKRQK